MRQLGVRCDWGGLRFSVLGSMHPSDSLPMLIMAFQLGQSSTGKETKALKAVSLNPYTLNSQTLNPQTSNSQPQIKGLTKNPQPFDRQVVYQVSFVLRHHYWESPKPENLPQ